MHILVVGAGVVGLAVARQAALAGHEVIVAEATNAIGTGTSSRNSEVIHAGIYYPTDSLRAQHCVRGRRMMYALCESHGVPHRKVGKLLIVTDEADIPKLDAIYKQSQINGVEGMSQLDAADAMRMEPGLSCVAAYLSAQTGIVDSHRFMLAMRGDIEDRGGAIAFNTPIERLGRDGACWEVYFGGAQPDIIAVDAVVNAAGHGAQQLALATDGYPADRVPPHVMAKGNYFKFSGKTPFSRLIYPAPVPGGLGIHITLDMGSGMKFGPDVEWIDVENYEVDPARAPSFYKYIRKYWPGLPDGSLIPDYAGIRPKITRQGEPAADFRIDRPQDHGVPGLVQMFGIELPGLTSSLSLAEYVIDSLNQ